MDRFWGIALGTNIMGAILPPITWVNIANLVMVIVLLYARLERSDRTTLGP